jgi:hypothetical protein
MRDLGTLPGDVASGGTWINESGVAVGPSFDASGNPRAYVWWNGVMTGLSALVPPDSPLYLIWASSINSSGEIVGFGRDQYRGRSRVSGHAKQERRRTGCAPIDRAVLRAARFPGTIDTMGGRRIARFTRFAILGAFLRAADRRRLMTTAPRLTEALGLLGRSRRAGGDALAMFAGSAPGAGRIQRADPPTPCRTGARSASRGR